jgi:very-short-patch-repair endonuclease
MKKKSFLEDELDRQLLGIKPFVPYKRQFRFHPYRLWRFDFCFPQFKLGIEVQGGIWSRNPGDHTRGSGVQEDCEKLSEAALLGYLVFQFTEKMIYKAWAFTIIDDFIKIHAGLKTHNQRIERQIKFNEQDLFRKTTKKKIPGFGPG